MADRAKFAAVLSAVWALTGIGLLFLFAVFRLGRRGVLTIQQGLSAGQWAVLVALVVIFVYTEGADALQRRWVPRVIARAAELRQGRILAYQLLAPAFAMSLIGAARRDAVRAWITTNAIVLAVLLVRTFPQPWRGITDLAVACGLAWGLGAIVLQAPRAFR
jgi:hypothetical protein